MNNKKTIAIDIDDVLARSAEALVRFSNEKYKTSLNIDDYDEDWSKIWGVDYGEMQRRVSEYFSGNKVLEYDHIDNTYEVLSILKDKFNLIIITARSVRHTKQDTLKWIDARFPGIFNEDAIYFAGIWDGEIDNNTVNLTKGELCNNLKIDYLIDDQVKHCLSATEFGIKSLLFGDYKWNRHDIINDLVVRVKDWNDINGYFLEQ